MLKNRRFRRPVLSLLMILSVLLLTACVAPAAPQTPGTTPAAPVADTYPSKPITFVVGYAAGGGTDIFTRVVASALPEYLGQPALVVNKPGAAGTSAAAEVAAAKPDGYTVYAGFISNVVITPHLQKVPYTAADFIPVAQMGAIPVIMATRPGLGVKNIDELVAMAKANPGKLTYGTDGVGGLPHLASERLFEARGVQLKMVPFGGAGESSAAALGGHVDVYVGSLSPILAHMQDGKMEGLVVFGSERDKAAPDVPSVKDIGHPDLATEAWRGYFVPKGTPMDIVSKLEAAMLKLPENNAFKTMMSKIGETPVILNQADFAKRVSKEWDDFGKILKTSK